MKELDLKHLTGYLPHNLKIKYQERLQVMNLGEGHSLHWIGIKSVIRWQNVNGEPPKPIVRPLSDLTKEIEVNGKTFVPIVELAEIAWVDTTKYVLSARETVFGIQCDIENDDDEDIHEVFAFDIINGFGHHYRPSNKWKIVSNQLELWEKLQEWHFWIYDQSAFEEGLIIDINTLKS